MDPVANTPPSAPTPPLSGSGVKSLEGILEQYLVTKAPFSLPANIKELLVKIAPWLSVLGIIIALPVILIFLGLGSFMYSFGGMAYTGSWYYLGLVVAAATIALEAVAIPGLFKRSLKAWRLIFYAVLLQLVSNLIGGNLISAVLSGLISLYFLFQIKSYYK
ncbi:MAG: chromate transporter [Candidatus Magasanikbacteria bacterium]|nr:chromate transporter [Candidatus Magasanikbacteria bacterium]